ncbi:MAG: DUF3748 domain-containing protein [Candidatus Hydrogenedentes bacterium]|jgi:hypothetical protein|nr:DUF3748 domain-containing protein [Candidatus Hydrogenedentota bacterium]
MNKQRFIGAACILLSLCVAEKTWSLDMNPEEQLTFAAQTHSLDNNDNFSADGRFLCYDTRETVGPGIENSQTLELLEIATGRSIIVYKPKTSIIGVNAAPGVGAVSFALAGNEVSFIHGPFVEELPERGFYGKPNRNGARIRLDGEIVEREGRWHMLDHGEYALSWLDKRDVAVDRDTLPGAHRGGTHRHEYCRQGMRIGFTYDDFLLPEYDRTIGILEPHPEAPAPASHYFALLVPVVPKGTSKAGEFEKAYGDSWVDGEGAMRAFIGVVRADDGVNYEESLFVVDIPADLDVTTADAGSASRFPAPPQGLRIRRLTHDWAGGIVRGSPDGKQIAYHGKGADGKTQLFVISAFGSDRDPDPKNQPRQASVLEHGTAEAPIRWSVDGNALLTVSNNGLAVTWVKEGPAFGKSLFLTEQGDGRNRHAPVISPDGKWIAYNCPAVTRDKAGDSVKNYAGEDFVQIFRIPFPELTEADFK